MKKLKNKFSKLIENKRDSFIEVSDKVWDSPEIRFEGTEALKAYYEVLEEEKFEIQRGVGDLEHAFIATYGSGKPVIGILAEYDALANLSQEADLAEKKQIVEGGCGHACGHNLLGAGALAGAVGIKDLMEQEGLSGTINLFGCPAEENGSGKAFMARDGVFDNLDIALTWHPMDTTSAWANSSLAVYQVYYKFKGISSHAAAAPEYGRSALDAAELMNIGVQFLREHMIDQARVHYAYTDVGGVSPNVVQPSASLVYLMRSPKRDQVEAIYQRINKIAQGAALMTETELQIEFDSASANFIANKPLTKSMHDNLELVTPMELSKEDLEYQQRYFNILSDADKEGLYQRVSKTYPELSEQEQRELASKPINDKLAPLKFEDSALGSTDVGDVSWVVPTAQITVGCEPHGAPPHSWQWVSNGKSSVAHKGLLMAGKVIAMTAYDILTNEELLEDAKKDHFNVFKGEKYISPIPSHVKPR